MPQTSSHIITDPNAFVIEAEHSAGLLLRLKGGVVSIAGKWAGVLNPTLTMADNATNYVEVNDAGVVSTNTTGFTAGRGFLYAVTTAAGRVTGVQDWRYSPITDPGNKIARGQTTLTSAATTVVTGLASVASVVAVLESDAVLTCASVSAQLGNQSGAPAAGSVILKAWMPTSVSNPTPIAATGFASKVVNWIAVGT